MDPVERYRGSLLGLAVGDALGTTVEFARPGTFQPVTEIVGGGFFRLAPGQWTADTSTALCLAESLIETHGFDPTDQLERYVSWYRNGHMSSVGYCFDIGMTVREALNRFENTRQPYCGSTHPMSAGNGSNYAVGPRTFALGSQASGGACKLGCEFAHHSRRGLRSGRLPIPGSFAGWSHCRNRQSRTSCRTLYPGCRLLGRKSLGTRNRGDRGRLV